jgi:sugar phosphate isomerase/epimerase
MTNLIAFSTLACPGWPAETVVERAAAYGYDALEWRGGSAGHIHPGLPREQVAGLARRMRASGLAALALTAYTSFVSEARAEREASLDDRARGQGELVVIKPITRSAFATGCVRMASER